MSKENMQEQVMNSSKSNSSNLAGIQDSYLKSQPKTLTNDKWQTKRKKKMQFLKQIRGYKLQEYN